MKLGSRGPKESLGGIEIMEGIQCLLRGIFSLLFGTGITALFRMLKYCCADLFIY